MPVPDADQPAVIEAVFVDFRSVPSRGVVRLGFEIPAEFAQRAMNAMGGVPSPGHSAHVAIARIYPATEAKDPRMDPTTPEQEGKNAVAAAGIMANKPEFQRYSLGDAWDAADPKANRDGAAQWIRDTTVVESRTEFRTDLNKLRAWRALVAKFEAHQATLPQVEAHEELPPHERLPHVAASQVFARRSATKERR